MPVKVPLERAKILDLETVTLGARRPDFDVVQRLLGKFGYLRPEQGPKQGTLDDVTSTALARYQRFHGLEPTGLFDESTREMMSRSRCMLPDTAPPAASSTASAPTASTTCAWNKTSLTYAFDSSTSDITGEAERDAVRNAFITWSAAIHVSFREVAIGSDPDIRIGWKNVNCGDTDMTGTTLAHADYPPGCGYYGNARPRPLHFDDQEHAWCIGSVSGEYDVETVALHEIGHILGLAHSSVSGAVMFPTVSSNSTKRVLAADDLEGIRRLYPVTGPLFARHSGRCLDIAGIATGNGADAIQWDYWGGQNQIFKVEWVEAQHYRLIAQHSNKVIDIEAQSTANGAQIHQWDWWGGNNQKFRLDPVGHGYYRIVPRHSGKSLDVSGISTANGARVIQWDWWGGNNQQWRLGPAPVTSRHSGKGLDVSGISKANGAPVVQWDYWGGGNQKFRLDAVGGGFYRIMIEHSGKCLDVEGISTANGARIIQWDYWGGDNQKFRPEPLGDGYYKLVAKHSGKALDVFNWATTNGGQIVQWDVHNGNNQKWRL